MTDHWQPIATAPRNNTRVLWCVAGGPNARYPWTYAVISWPEFKEIFEVRGGWWMPLPEPPGTANTEPQ